MSYNSQSQPSNAATQSLVMLSSELKLLSQSTQQLAQLTQVTAEQAKYMRLLAGNQAAVFMAAQKVFVPQDDPEGEARREEEQR